MSITNIWLGEAHPTDTITNLMQLAPLWTSVLEDNSDLPDFDDLHILGMVSLPGLDGRLRPLVMQNADIAFAHVLNTTNMNPNTGEVSCQVCRQSRRPPNLPICGRCHSGCGPIPIQ